MSTAITLTKENPVAAGTPGRTRPVRGSHRLFSAIRRLAGLTGWLVVIGCALLFLVPALLGYQRYAIVGSSMSGAFERGSLALTREVPVEDLQVGDVVTYRPPPATGVTGLVTHRIVSAQVGDDGERTFRTKGDANATADPWVFRLTGDTQAVVTSALPGAGWILIVLSNPATRVWVIGVPAALVAVSALVELRRSLRRAPEGERP